MRFFNAKLWGRGETAFETESGQFKSFSNQGTGDVDLGGRWVYPGFVDAHCHILPTGLDLQKLQLGQCQSQQDVLDAVRGAMTSLEPGQWLQAVHYDQNRFVGGAHLDREQLDRISSTIPILLRHVNGHASVANSAALEAAGVDGSTPDPEGGEYHRDASGRLTGLLLEDAHSDVTDKVPHPDLEQMVSAILRACDAMAKLGVTTATDMMTGRWDLATELRAYKLAAERGAPVRLRLMLQWGRVFGARAISRDLLNELVGEMDEDRCKVVGIKIFADGAIGSATAAIYGAFNTTGGDGQLIYKPERLNQMVTTASSAGYPVAIHTIGDRSSDLVMDAFELTEEPSKHRIEHIMMMSDAQIERLASIGCHSTMQPEFLAHFGHVYRAQLGPERASKLKRARSVLDAGIPLSFNSDRPIVQGDPLVGIQMAVQRPEGFDPAENVTYEEAVRAYTEMGAHSNRDVGRYGQLVPGMAADFVVLSADRSRVEETWSAGNQFAEN